MLLRNVNDFPHFIRLSYLRKVIKRTTPKVHAAFTLWIEVRISLIIIFALYEFIIEPWIGLNFDLVDE